jgi:hypothetical protein
MIKCLENRIWSLNARILSTDEDPLSVDRKLNENIKEGIFRDGGVRFQYSENPVGNYSFRPVEITLLMTPVSMGRFQEMLNLKNIPFKLSSFRMIINTFGFLNIVPVYEFTGKYNPEDPSEIESFGDASAEVTDSLFDDISAIIDQMNSMGIIGKSAFYHFGVPSGISKYGIHTKDDSYNYLVHQFYFNENEDLNQAVKHYQVESQSNTYEDHLYYAIFPIYFWNLKQQADDEALVKLTAIDSYMICQTVAINNSLHVYNSFLDTLNQDLEIDSNHLRNIFNYNTWQIQNLRLFNPNFTLHQFRFMKNYRQNSDIESKYELFKDAEKSLSFAIEGMEVSRTQQSERVMQFILALFTALTLYSVITDVYALITSEVQSVPFSLHSMQSIIFILETLVIISFILFFRKISRKL